MAETKKKPGRPPGSKNKGSSKTKSTAKAKEALLQKEKKNRMKDEIWSIVITAIGLFLVVALQTEAAGQLGHAIKTILMGTFGAVAYILPYYMIVYGFLLFTKRTVHIGSRSVVLVFLIFSMITILNSARYLGHGETALSVKYIIKMFDAGVAGDSGGVFGMFVGSLLIKIIGMTGLYILTIMAILISIMLVVNTPFSQFLDEIKAKKQLKNEELYVEDDEYFDEKDLNETNNIYENKKRTNKNNKVKNHLPDKLEIGGMSKGQKKILDYMKDDALFEKQSNENVDILGVDVISNNIEELVDEKEYDNDIIVNPQIQDSTKTNVDSKDELENLKSQFQQFEEKNTDVNENKEKIEKISNSEAASATLKPEELNIHEKPKKPYEFPNINLLNKGPKENKLGENESLRAKAMKLEKTLHDFNVNAKVIQVTKGPAVTRYEIQPNTGVKVSSIVRLADDIALNLEAKSIRLEAPIPGKAAVGIEVENDRVNMVTIREIIESPEFKHAKSKISFAVGKDIAGNSIVADLKGMPHMLIAGSTGSGKSVCINSIIISLLYKAKPEEVKFVLIDPKVVELGNYNGIPHLLIPVVTEPSKAAAALNWAVAEMTDRYKKFAEEGVRDLESYNKHVKEKKEEDKFLPQIVIIIDELADLMMAAPSQVEESICRLAQMARAAGMHLIVATQRPSVDIITGVIKANIPSRIAFAVSSQFDSRTILDMAGAEKLVGKGDMLFNPLGMAKPLRVQGTFISDTEVHNIIEFIKGQAAEVEYANDVIHSIEKVQTTSNDDDEDQLLPEAIETVVKAKQASVSMLQRRFRIGYNRAARLVDIMESRGIVGPADGSRPRQVFMTEEELLNLDKEVQAEE
ncbi:FtsK/SpoIIIE family DNA translocase [Anaerovorax odorimutans]|uniref:FtsK/SpoIIIE family DNA translocase n=1 Tax=Anaerovorax odorimutans TaxID=109327 RepID=UPI0004087D85|nr:DNA translocase FtsK [Anaerovorax odorimutans]